jgi:hypothetical protein
LPDCAHLEPRPDEQLRSLKDIVDDYRRIRPSGDRDLGWYRTLALGDAIEWAAQAKTCDDKRHPHQTRITPVAIRSATQALRKLAGRISRCTTFAELHGVLGEKLLPIRGIGEMYVYDCAQRIGESMKLKPAEIFMHRGTREGARALVPDASRRAYVRVEELPRALRVLSAAELEDVLCIYKSTLRRLAQG